MVSGSNPKKIRNNSNILFKVFTVHYRRVFLGADPSGAFLKGLKFPNEFDRSHGDGSRPVAIREKSEILHR